MSRLKSPFSGCISENGLFAVFILSDDDQFRDEHDDAAGGGNLEQAGAVPGEADAGDEGERAGDRCLRSFGDGREGHHGQRHIGDIEQEGPQEAVPDLLADQRQRDDADGDGHGTHDEQVDVDVMIHGQRPPCP